MNTSSKLIISLVACAIPVAAFAAFSDVSSKHPNYDAIMYAQTQNIVQGYSDGTFRPDQTINRAEFVKIIVGTLGLPTDTPMGASMTFPDVNIDRDWFFPYVISAYFSHLIEGYPDGTFRPANPINFAEAAKILTIGFELNEGAEGFESAAWFAPYVKILQSKSAIPTSIRSFDQRITRGEMAEMMYRLKAGITNKPTQTYDMLASGQPMMTVLVYLAYDTGSDFTYAPIEVAVPKSASVLRSALEALLTLPTKDGCYGYGEDCPLRSDLYLTHLTVASATIVDGVAHVELVGELGFAGDLSGPRAVEEITRTVMQFPSVKSADITINGSPLRCLGDLSGECQ